MLNCLFRCFLGDFVSKGQCLQRLVRTLELCRLTVCGHKNRFVCCVALCTLSVCGHRDSFVSGVALLSS